MINYAKAGRYPGETFTARHDHPYPRVPALFLDEETAAAALLEQDKNERAQWRGPFRQELALEYGWIVEVWYLVPHNQFLTTEGES